MSFQNPKRHPMLFPLPQLRPVSDYSEIVVGHGAPRADFSVCPSSPPRDVVHGLLRAMGREEEGKEGGRKAPIWLLYL